MPFDGSGVFTPVYNWEQDAANGIKILASRMDTQDEDFATNGLTLCITNNGQSVCTQLIPFAQGINVCTGTVIANATGLGINMSPVNILDITQTENAVSQIKLLNASAGAAAVAGLQFNNNLNRGCFLYYFGGGYTPSGLNRADGVQLQSSGDGGLTLTNSLARPIYFGVLNSEVARVGSDGSFLVGTTTNAGAGNIACSGTLSFGTYTGTPVTSAGYITVTDAGGNTRKLMVGT